MQQGALGHGDKIDQPKPALVEFFEQEGNRISQIACGSAHTLALDTEGTVWTWGEGEFGRLGNGVGSRAVPTKVELPDDSVRCVQVRIPSHASMVLPLPLPPPRDAASSLAVLVLQVAAGKDHSFALDSTGVAWGFGKNGHGQLGLLEVSAVDVNACESVPQPLEVIRDAGETVVQINGGNRNGIALTEAGHVYIWGDRLHLRPHKVDVWEGLMDGELIVQVAAGRNSWGALTSFGRVYTWGRNMFSGALAQAGGPQPKLLHSLNDISVQRLFLGHKAGAVVVGTPPRQPPALPVEPVPATP